jgi:hypothetical protein
MYVAVRGGMESRVALTAKAVIKRWMRSGSATRRIRRLVRSAPGGG